MALNAEDFDTDAYHDNSTNNSRLTVPTGLAGKYMINGTFAWSGSSTGKRYIGILLNGTTAIAQTGINVAQESSTISVLYNLAEGDYVELQAWQDSGIDRSTNEAAEPTSFSMFLI